MPGARGWLGAPSRPWGPMLPEPALILGSRSAPPRVAGLQALGDPLRPRQRVDGLDVPLGPLQPGGEVRGSLLDGHRRPDLRQEGPDALRPRPRRGHGFQVFGQELAVTRALLL